MLLEDTNLFLLAGAVLTGALLGGLLVAWRARGALRDAARLGSEIVAKTDELSLALGRLSTLQKELTEQGHQLETARARLERWSLEDELTGLANRRALHATLEEELSRMLRHGSALSLVLFDLDGFAALRTALGAEEAERCLERVGGYVRDQIRRRADLAARHGDARFALVLPDTALPGALAVAETLRAGVAALEIRADKGDGALTASFGAAQAAIDGTDRVVDLIQRAQEALERAQGEGRDRVVAAPTPAVGRS